MGGVAGAGAVESALARVELEAAYQGAVLRQQQEVQDLQGAQALHLIESAALPLGEIGQHLDVLA